MGIGETGFRRNGIRRNGVEPMSHLHFYLTTLSRNFIARQNGECDMTHRTTSQQLRNSFSE